MDLKGFLYECVIGSKTLNTVHDCFLKEYVTLRYIISGPSVYGIRGPFFAAKALWLIRFSLNEIPSSGCDSSFTLLSISSNIRNKCAQFFQIYNKDPRSIISTSF